MIKRTTLLQPQQILTGSHNISFRIGSIDLHLRRLEGRHFTNDTITLLI